MRRPTAATFRAEGPGGPGLSEHGVRGAAGRLASTAALAGRLGLKLIASDALALQRRREGDGFIYFTADGNRCDDDTARRLASLAVPPAYEDVLYAEDPAAHLQAVGRDAAGRLQYRYHPEWEKVREIRKARRLASLAEALPRIRRAVNQRLASQEPTCDLALAAVVELVAFSAIRPGSESHARLRGTRGAATLLKSNVSSEGDVVRLKFKAKGGKRVEKEFKCPRFVRALDVLMKVPGRRLFQYRAEDGGVRAINAHDVNRFLRDISAVHISLKDFRTLVASVTVLEALSQEIPAASKRARRRQVLEAIRAAADDLSNTPTICGRSYVNATVVAVFEEGALEKFADTLKGCRSSARREKALAEVMAEAAA